MLRIVGIQRAESSDQEFILLQNQGGLRVPLRGHLVLCEAALESPDLVRGAYAFPDSEAIPSGVHVLLSTGAGTPRWAKTKDGTLIYYTYMNRKLPQWLSAFGQLHILAIQHSYSERKEPALLLT